MAIALKPLDEQVVVITGASSGIGLATARLADAVVPLQGMYSASKHAVKGFTDALRVEVQEVDDAPVAITLIQPGATDTPFPHHARNYMDSEPKLPPPLDDPEDVAEAILDAATEGRATRESGSCRGSTPPPPASRRSWATGWRRSRRPGKQYDEPPRHPEGTLYRAGESGHVRGEREGME